MVSRILGFVKAAVLAQAIGVVASVSGDSFTVATAVPNSIYAIIAGGLLSAVLVPQIVRAGSHPDGGQAYINKLVTIAVLAFAVVAAVATVAAPALMQLYGARDVALASAFAYWCLPQIFFLGLYSVLGEVLNARRSFGPFTWAPALNNVVGIAAVLAFVVLYGSDQQRSAADWSPQMVALLGGGATLGIAVQAIVLFFFWRRVGLRFTPDFLWRGVNLGTAGRAAGWTFAMLVASQVAGWVETRVALEASGQGASAFTLSTAWLIFMLPHSIITVSLVTAYYTRMAEHVGRNDIPSLRRDLLNALRTVAMVIVLAAAGLIVVAYPFSRVFAEEFGDVEQMARVVIAYVIGLVPFSLLFVVQRCFYSLGDTKTPFFFTLFQVVLVIVGALACTLLPKDLIAVGIAAVISLASILQASLAGILLRRRIGAGIAAVVAMGLAVDLASVVPAAAGAALTLALLGGFRADGFAQSGILPAIASMIATGAVMSAIYLAVLRLLRSRDLADVVAPLLSRIAARRSGS